jgi:DNA-binding transcriptional MerR regulator
MIMKNTITIGKAAELLGVTVKTRPRGEREKWLFPSGRAETNRGRYTEAPLYAYLGQTQALKVPSRIDEVGGVRNQLH